MGDTPQFRIAANNTSENTASLWILLSKHVTTKTGNIYIYWRFYRIFAVSTIDLIAYVICVTYLLRKNGGVHHTSCLQQQKWQPCVFL
jgi:hypothetical protein